MAIAARPRRSTEAVVGDSEGAAVVGAAVVGAGDAVGSTGKHVTWSGGKKSRSVVIVMLCVGSSPEGSSQLTEAEIPSWIPMEKKDLFSKSMQPAMGEPNLCVPSIRNENSFCEHISLYYYLY